MKHRTSELLPPLLDRAAWLALKQDYPAAPGSRWPPEWMPSSKWEHGGPILERQMICIENMGDQWEAVNVAATCYGPTPLIAVMRAFVMSKLGKEIELP